MSSIGDLVANLVVNTQQWAAGLNKGKTDLSAFASSAASAIAPVAGMIAGVWGTSVSLSAAREDIKAMQKLEAVLNATGGTAGVSAEEIGKYASALQKTTNFGDELTVGSAAIIGTLKNINGENLKRAISLSQDMAVVWGIDLDAAAKKLVKSVKDLNPDEVTKKLAAMQDQFGGAAAAVADPWIQVKNVIGDIGEEIGKSLLPIINVLSRTTIPFLQSWGKEIAAVVVAMGTAIGVMRVIVGIQKSIAVGQALIQSLAGPAGWATLAAGAAVFAAALVTIETSLSDVAAAASGAVAAVGDFSDEIEAINSKPLSLLEKSKALGQTFKDNETAFNKLYESTFSDAKKLEIELANIDKIVKSYGAGANIAELIKQDAIDKAVGYSDAIEKISDEIAILSGAATESSLELDKMLKAGVSTDKVDALRSAQEMRDRLRQSKEEKAKSDADIAAALEKKKREGQAKPAEFAAQNSKQAYSTIVSTIQGGRDPIERNTSDAVKVLKNIDKNTKEKARQSQKGPTLTSLDKA